MDIISPILSQVIYLILFISLFIYFLKNKKIYSFVRGLFLTLCIFEVINFLFNIPLYYIQVEILQHIFAWEGSFSFLPKYLGHVSYFLMVFGITLLIGRKFKSEAAPEEPVAMQGKRRHIAISLLLFVVTLGIYFFFWLYRTVKDLRNNFKEEIPYTPGKAVGFMFIPIFNIFWSLYIIFSLPLRISCIEEKSFGKSIGFHFHPILISILVVFIQILSNVVLQIIAYSDLEIYSWQSHISLLLFAYTVLYILLLTIQAKLNAFFDLHRSKV